MHTKAALLGTIREFFAREDFLEIDTPVALTAPAPELHIEAPSVDVRLPDSTRRRRYLQTSPELPMKRVLALGFDRIFQIAAVFRDGDLSSIHRPEFRMLEWYRRNASWMTLIDDCEQLLLSCIRTLATLEFDSPVADTRFPLPRIQVEQAFKQHAGFSILGHLDRHSLYRRVVGLGLRPSEDDGWDDLFHRVFLDRVEPALLAEHAAFFLTHYPAPLASLARLSPDDPRVAERFELYLAKMELANGFGELVDEPEQRRRFTRESEARARAGKAPYPIDEHFLSSLAALPPSAGIAMGFDRLLLACLGGDDLDDVAFLPWTET